MRGRAKAKNSPLPRRGAAAKRQHLDLHLAYQNLLAALQQAGTTAGIDQGLELPLINLIPGLEGLLHSMASVAVAASDAPDEEWNPLSQRPHSPLILDLGQAVFGQDIQAEKDAVDGLTTLAHEAMHVALWEPFFVGKWRPGSAAEFRLFSLAAEGYCFYFTDIVVSGSIRHILPDGEMALARITPSNTLFHPKRAFAAMGEHDNDKILSYYLAAFTGDLRPLGKDLAPLASTWCQQIRSFYEGSLSYLDRLYLVLEEYGYFTDFYTRFCNIPGLPGFAGVALGALGHSPISAITSFHGEALNALAKMGKATLRAIRLRRMLQTRAYFVWQVQWALQHNAYTAQRPGARFNPRGILRAIGTYLRQIEALLLDLAQGRSQRGILAALEALDDSYELSVRRPLAKFAVWTLRRDFVAPRQAGGGIDCRLHRFADARAAQIAQLEIAKYLVMNLSENLAKTRRIAERVAVLALLKKVALLGEQVGNHEGAGVVRAWTKLKNLLMSPEILPLWSLALTSIDPKNNRYRELLFSYR